MFLYGKVFWGQCSTSISPGTSSTFFSLFYSVVVETGDGVSFRLKKDVVIWSDTSIGPELVCTSQSEKPMRVRLLSDHRTLRIQASFVAFKKNINLES